MHEREQRRDELRREAAKPFARTRDDADLEASLRGLAASDLSWAHFVCMHVMPSPA